jgi:two-component system, sensor histidine kinase and response regulator
MNSKDSGAGFMKNVLVVDDEVDILKLVSVNLTIRGYQVAEAQNGTQALAQVQSNPPALMVLDIKLPDFTGWELLKRIKKDAQITTAFPVLVITASITETAVDLEAFPSVVEILIKPFSTARLVSAVEHALGHR